MYGIEESDKNYIDEMISKQRDFLKANDLNVVSATITPKKYLAELYNRINAMTALAKEESLIPVFITITAPSRYHNSSSDYNNSTPKETSLYLSHLWAKLLRTKPFKNMKEKNLIYHFFRTYEPHKSGVPHLHAMLYLSREYVLPVKKSLLFQMEKERIKQYKYLFQFKNAKYDDNYSGSTAYIIKYINKSLFSSSNNNLDDIAYWYAKHGIRRFLTSRSLIPLFIYRKLNYLDDFKDMKTITIHMQNSRIVLSEKRTEINYYYFDKEELVYTDKMLWSKPLSDPSKKTKMKLKPKKKKTIPIIINGVEKVYINQEYIVNKSTVKLSFDLYSDTELYRYIKELEKDIDNNIDINLKRYAIFRNEAIYRGLIFEEPFSPDLYDEFFNFEIPF